MLHKSQVSSSKAVSAVLWVAFFSLAAFQAVAESDLHTSSSPKRITSSTDGTILKQAKTDAEEGDTGLDRLRGALASERPGQWMPKYPDEEGPFGAKSGPDQEEGLTTDSQQNDTTAEEGTDGQISEPVLGQLDDLTHYASPPSKNEQDLSKRAKRSLGPEWFDENDRFSLGPLQLTVKSEKASHNPRRHQTDEMVHEEGHQKRAFVRDIVSGVFDGTSRGPEETVMNEVGAFSQMEPRSDVDNDLSFAEKNRLMMEAEYYKKYLMEHDSGRPRVMELRSRQGQEGQMSAVFSSDQAPSQQLNSELASQVMEVGNSMARSIMKRRPKVGRYDVPQICKYFK